MENKEAQSKKINTLKEETALRTAEIFLDYAKWGEAKFGFFKINFWLPIKK